MKYVISDLHGCYDEFMEILSVIEFTDKDDMFIIGDVVDRGPEPIKLLKYIMETPNLHLLLGNHEDMMRKSTVPPECTPEEETELASLHSYEENRNRWYLNGGYITNSQYEVLTISEKRAILDYMNQLPITLEVETNGKSYVLLHGGPNQSFVSDWEGGRVSEDVIWERPTQLFTNDVILPGKTIIVGHTPTFFYGGDSQVIMVDDKWLIDCGCVFGYSLGCVCLDNEQIYYVESRQPKQ